MIVREDLARAAFDNDAVADEHPSNAIITVAHKCNTTAGAVAFVAEQRALRMVIADRGPEEIERISQQAYDNVASIENLTPDEILLLLAYKAVWIDACLTGMRAMQTEFRGGGYFHNG